MSETFFLSLPVFLLLGIGALLVRLGRESEAGEALALRLIIELFMPCFILSKVLGVEGIGDPVRLALLLVSGVLLTALQLAIALGAARLIGLEQGGGRRTFAVSTGILNYGYLAIPIIQGLFGSGAVLASLLVHNVGNEVAIWTIGVSLYGSTFSWRRLVNMPLAALILALSLNFLGVGERMPEWVMDFLDLAGAAAIPLGIVIAGMAIGRPGGGLGLRDLLRHWKITVGAVVLRLGLFPLGLLGLAVWLEHVDWPELAAVLAVHAAMPSAVMPVVLARHFGGHPLTAVQVLVVTTAVSLLTTPLWLALAGRWLGWP